MTYRLKRTATATLFLLINFSAHATESPYAGQEKRAIKALSEQEISDYLHGRGMGMSKAAELNRYPGPRHVLDAANQLGLSAEQLKKTQEIYDAMTHAAQRTGKAIVQKEAELEALYANRKATVENTARLVRELADLQAELRMTHLNAHLITHRILSRQQIEMYDQVRGYGGTKSHGGGHKHH
jgi:hypothetical protein